MIEIKTKHIIIGVITALVVTFIGGWLLGRLARDNASTAIIGGQNDIITTYEYQIGDMQRRAAEKDAIIQSQREALRQGVILQEELKALKLKYVRDLTRINGKVEILLDSIAQFHPVVIPCPPDELYHPVLYLPLAWRDTTEFYDVSGLFDEDGKLSVAIKIPLSMDVWTGYDKKTKKIKAVLTYDNPYLKTIDIKSVVMDVGKPRHFGIGVIGGYGFGWGSYKPVPIIGVGLSYNIIQF